MGETRDVLTEASDADLDLALDNIRRRIIREDDALIGNYGVIPDVRPVLEQRYMQIKSEIARRKALVAAPPSRGTAEPETTHG